jgi:dTDP-4-amino-4,6-dideoxygalactose transaminase
MKNYRIRLSEPFFDNSDLKSISDLLCGVNVNELTESVTIFEKMIANLNGVKNVVAVSSGTSAIHLALLALKVAPGDKILVPSLTFAATAYPIKYLGANPIFLDVEDSSWTLNLSLVEDFLENCNPLNYPKAIIAVDLFGRACNYNRLAQISRRYSIPIIVDAAESLGSTFETQPTTSQGLISILSFNLNKIITTTGGGAFLTNDNELAIYARKLANQARENVHWYEHLEIGYNYRLSPILAALGKSQFEKLTQMVEKRRAIRERYTENLSNYLGIKIIQDSIWEKSNAWLTNIRFSEDIFPKAREIVRENLQKQLIETRYVWKPLHLQPIFKTDYGLLDGTSEKIYEQSLCLPSSYGLSLNTIDEISENILISLNIL